MLCMHWRFWRCYTCCWGLFFVMLEHCGHTTYHLFRALFSSLGNFTAHLLSRAKKTFEMADVVKPPRPILQFSVQIIQSKKAYTFRLKSLNFAQCSDKCVSFGACEHSTCINGSECSSFVRRRCKHELFSHS